MLVGDRFFFEAFDVHIDAILVIIGITLASHATGSMLLKCMEIIVNYFLSCLFPAFRHSKGHNIPYHSAYSFGFTAGHTMASVKQEMLLYLQMCCYFLDKRQKKGIQRINKNLLLFIIQFYSVNILPVSSLSCWYTSSRKFNWPASSTQAV